MIVMNRTPNGYFCKQTATVLASTLDMDSMAGHFGAVAQKASAFFRASGEAGSNALPEASLISGTLAQGAMNAETFMSPSAVKKGEGYPQEPPFTSR